jgi:hypothetical protein
MVNAYEPTATTLLMRVDGESSIWIEKTSASGSDFMFSCPPRQEAQGQAARNNPKGYTLVCPSPHVTVNSRFDLLAVTPVGFSFMFYFLFSPQLNCGLNDLIRAALRLRVSDCTQPSALRKIIMAAARPRGNSQQPNLRVSHHTARRYTTRCIRPHLWGHLLQRTLRPLRL